MKLLTKLEKEFKEKKNNIENLFNGELNELKKKIENAAAAPTPAPPKPNPEPTPGPKEDLFSNIDKSIKYINKIISKNYKLERVDEELILMDLVSKREYEPIYKGWEFYINKNDTKFFVSKIDKTAMLGISDMFGIFFDEKFKKTYYAKWDKNISDYDKNTTWVHPWEQADNEEEKTAAEKAAAEKAAAEKAAAEKAAAEKAAAEKAAAEKEAKEKARKAEEAKAKAKKTKVPPPPEGLLLPADEKSAGPPSSPEASSVLSSFEQALKKGKNSLLDIKQNKKEIKYKLNTNLKKLMFVKNNYVPGNEFTNYVDLITNSNRLLVYSRNGKSRTGGGTAEIGDNKNAFGITLGLNSGKGQGFTDLNMKLEDKNSIDTGTYDQQFIKDFMDKKDKTVKSLINLEFDYLRKRIINESKDKTKLQVYFPFDEKFIKWGAGVYRQGSGPEYVTAFNKIRTHVTSKVSELIDGFTNDNKNIIVKTYDNPNNNALISSYIYNFFKSIEDDEDEEDNGDDSDWDAGGGACSPKFRQLLKDITKFTSKKNKIKIIKLLKAVVKKLKQKLNINMMMFPFFGFMGGNKDLDNMTDTELNNMGMKLIDEIKDIAIKYKNIIDKFPWFKKVLNMF